MQYRLITLLLNVVRPVLALLFLYAPLATHAHATDNANSPLGVNVREVRYWGTETHFVDFFKRAGNGENAVWLTQCAAPCGGANTWNTKEQALLDLDADGWPKSLPAVSDSVTKYRFVTTILWMNSTKLPVGRWTVLYDGEGSLSYGLTGVTRNGGASRPGIDAVDVASGAGSLTLSITATDPSRNGNYLRNVRVIPPGGTCNNDPASYAADAANCPASYRPLTQTYASEPFHPQFLRDIQPFAALRFMQFFSTNLDQTSLWSERSKPTDVSWGYRAGRGAPIEVALDMALAARASPWLSIPAKVDDDYVRQYARLAKGRFTGTRPIYVEYGNEVWNGAYPYSLAGQWILTQAKARWATTAESDFAKQMNWFAMRTKQICAIWKEEFGAQSGQVKCVMGSQGAGDWMTDHYLLPCPLHAAEPGGSTCDAKGGIDAFAVGFYVGGHVNNPAFQSQIESQWFTQADGGLSKLFQEISDGSVLTNPSGVNMAHASVSLVASMMARNRALAEKYGIEMLVYEGGNELFGRDGSTYQTKVQSLAELAQRDQRMGSTYSAILNHWKANQGHLYMVFESTGAFSGSRGNSALLEWTGQPRTESPKYDAVLGFVESNMCWWSGCASVAPTSVESQRFAARSSATELTVDWLPEALHRSQSGQTYAVALFQGAVFAYGAQGWSRWTGGALPSWTRDTLNPVSATVLSGVDLATLTGLQVWLGYGLGVGDSATTEMLSSARFQRVFP